MPLTNDNVNQKLFAFIEASPCSFHAVAALKQELDEAGFRALSETEPWHLERGGCYYVDRNGSSLISFRIPSSGPDCFHIISSHSDSPSFKIKPGSAVSGDGGLMKLNVERYGGAIDSTWFDRPLSVAGRVIADADGILHEHLVYLDQDLLMIPSLAIHMSRTDSTQKALNIQTDMQPVIAAGTDENVLWNMIAASLGVREDQLVSSDLYLCSRQKPVLWGADQEFIGSPRLDDLECCYCSFLGFLASRSERDIPVHCVFDNEEVGSRTRQGADSSFLRDTLERICFGLGISEEGFRAMIARSFMISADNAHAVHPNFPQKADPVNRPSLNGGIVLKYQAEQRYATDARTAAVFRTLCRRHEISCQDYTNRSDIPGGSTLGNISGTQIPIPTVDIGLPQLAMHSIFETAGAHDTLSLVRLATVFYRETLPALIPSL